MSRVSTLDMYALPCNQRQSLLENDFHCDTFPLPLTFQGTAGKPCEFTVETKGAGIDSLGFAIEGPSQAEIHCQERSPGICDVRYYPTTPGKYAIHVTCGDEDIHKSPFMVPISPPGDAKEVYAKGPGLEPEGVVSGIDLLTV